MEQIKDNVILMEDGTYWVAGGIVEKGAIMTSKILSHATFLNSDDAHHKATKLTENGRKCEATSVILKIELYEKIKQVCMHRKVGFEDESGYIPTCRHDLNIPQGHSWGHCNNNDCPVIKEKIKVFTIYINGATGWTNNNTEGFYTEYENIVYEQEITLKVLSEEEFNKNIESLNIGEKYTLQIGNTELEIRCTEMSEKTYSDLPEFSGW